MNNKGITLIELLISISLTSITIIFLFKLLVDIRATYSSDNYNKANQQKRAIIVRTVERDFLNEGLIGIKDDGSTNGNLKISFKYSTGKTGILEASNNAITYQDANNTKEVWHLDDESYHYVTNCASYKFYQSGNDFYIKFTIIVNKDNTDNNYLDDIEFTYTGRDINAQDFKISNVLGVC